MGTETKSQGQRISDISPEAYRKARESGDTFEGEPEEPSETDDEKETVEKQAEKEAAEPENTGDEEEEPGAVDDDEDEEAETKTQSGKGEEEPKKGGVPKGVQKRIDELTRRAREAEEKLAAATKTKEEPPAKEPEVEAKKPQKPNIEDFDDQESFDKAIEAYDDELFEYRYHQRRAKESQAAEKQAREAAAAKAKEEWDRKLTEASAKHEDFQKVIAESKVMFSPAMQDVMFSSEIGAELGYALSKDPKEAERIIDLGPLDQVYEMKQLEASLLNGSKKKGKSTEPVIRQPKPGETVKSGSGGTKKPLSELSPAEYRARREAGEGT